MLDGMLAEVQRRMAAAMLVGVLTFGGPESRSLPLTSPQAIVRVQSSSGGAQVWRELFPSRPAPN